MNMGRFKNTYFVVLLVALFFMSGCVTESTRNGQPYEPVERQVDKEKIAKDYAALADGYMRNGDRENALRAINKGLKINPDSGEIRNILAFYYNSDGETELAEREFRNAISADSKYTATYMNFGVFLYNNSRYEEACRMFEKAANDVMYNKRDDAFVNLGRCYSKQKQNAKADEVYERALMHNFRNSAAQLELAESYFEKGEFDKSQKFYNEYLRFGQQSPKTLWLGIRLAHVSGDQDREASYALFLKNQYPDSNEYAEYQRWKALN